MASARKIAVIGGNGFIGRNLVTALAKAGHTVYVIDVNIEWPGAPPGVIFEQCDISRWKPKSKSDVDVVFHLAALIDMREGEYLELEYLETNIVGTQAVIDFFPDARLVFASSVAALNPTSIYGLTKYAGECLVKRHKNHVIVRMQNVYGPHQIHKGVMPRMIKGAHGGIIEIDGDGHQRRDFVYVGDVVKIMMRVGFAKNSPSSNDVVNISTGKLTPIYTVAKQIRALLGNRAQIRYRPNAEIGVIEPVRLGPPTCKTTFIQGLRKTISWYKNQWRGAE